MIIKEISLEEALPVRHLAMWPDKDLDFVRVPGDEEATHLGLFANRELISVVSVFKKEEGAQFRKFATLPKHQGKGYGSKLLVYMIGFMQKKDVPKIWCNARVSKIDFYSNFGLVTTPKTFQKAGLDYVVMEKVL
ncbi:GNAT family N-acetyltransferase [Belliella pelovolcani]|jgi:GNAT superfamily N-acetyltransferase|uniref:Acetyltransferase (GNAT) domain-containing protein n=1 Tax=Belliella pelovolcani TaxID=529505 RepID=A0A1N7LX44_9BACT|nr:GNAT family N-acetyltransferase [Belliella pelovolcani]SIS78374.1 Acetyltransferase (GNAT) domain-containing protein [Belliella pelovolcani]